jgi:predicted amidohydrolase
MGEEGCIGNLKAGMEADVSVLELKSGRWKFEDSEHKTIEVDNFISPVLTVKGGQVIPAKPAAQPMQIG